MTIHLKINLRKAALIAVAVLAVLGLIWAVDAIASPYPTGVGGTGTQSAPASGQTLIGTGSSSYTPGYLLCSGNCSVQSASGTITISVPPQTTSTVTIYPVSAATSSFSIVGDGSYITVTNPATSTIKISLSTVQVLQLISAASPLTYTSSTGQFSCASCLTSLNGALLVTNNLSDVASTTAARSNLGLGSIATYSKTDYLTSSTVYVSSVNGSSGAVTITSSSLGVTPFATTSINGTPALAFHIVGDGMTITSTVSGATTTFSVIPGVFLTSASGTAEFYPLSGNPSGFTSTTIQSVLNSLSAAGCLTYSTSTGVFTANCLSTSTAATTYVPYTGATGNVNLGSNSFSAANGTFNNVVNIGTSTAYAIAPLNITVATSNSAFVPIQTYSVQDNAGSNRLDQIVFEGGATSARGGKIAFSEPTGTGALGLNMEQIIFGLSHLYIEQTSTNPIGFYTNQVQRVTIQGNGNTDFGTVTDDGNTVHISGNADMTGALAVGTTTTSTATLNDNGSLYVATTSTLNGTTTASGGIVNASGTHIGATYAELVSPVAGEGDFTSIQPAITADCALASPGIVYVKNGIYDLGSTGLTVPSTCAGFGLFGEVESSTRITYEGSGTAINLGDNSGSITKANVGNFSIVGSSSGLIGLNVERAQVSNIHDLYVTGFTKTATSSALQGKGIVFSGDSTLNADNYTSNVHEDHNDIDLLVASTSNANYFTGLDLYGQTNPSSTLLEVVNGVGNTFDISNLSSATNGAVINTSGNIVNIGYGELLTNELVFGSSATDNFAIEQVFSNVTSTLTDNSSGGTNDVFVMNGNTILASTTVTSGGLTVTNGQGNFSSSGNGALNSFRGSTGNYDTQCVGTGSTAWWCEQLSPDGTNDLKIVDSQDGGAILEGDTNGTTTIGNSGSGSAIVIGGTSTKVDVPSVTSSIVATDGSGNLVPVNTSNPQYKWVKPYQWVVAATNATSASKNTVYSEEFELPFAENVCGITFVGGASTSTAWVWGAISGMASTSTDTNSSLSVLASATTTEAGFAANQSIPITLPTTMLAGGRYYLNLQLTDTTSSYQRYGNQTQVTGWTQTWTNASTSTFPTNIPVSVTNTPSNFPGAVVQFCSNATP
jgi:hypothetical protein